MKKKKDKILFTLEYSDGTPFEVPEFTKAEKAEIIKRWKKVKEQFRASVGTRQGLETGITHEDFLATLESGRKLTESQFTDQFPAIRQFLDRQGKISPANFRQFLNWFVGVKYGRTPFLEMMKKWPDITLSDFKEFHEYAESLFEHGGRIEDIGVLWRDVTQKTPKDSDNVGSQPKSKFDLLVAFPFEELFVGNSKEEKAKNCKLALEAAKQVDPPLINQNDRLLPNYLKLPGIRAFYDACFDAGLLSSEFSILEAMKMISKKFTGKEAGKNAAQPKADPKLKSKLVAKLTDLQREFRESGESL